MNNVTSSQLSLAQNPIFSYDIIHNERTKNINDNYKSITNLIIVAGHAVYSHYDYSECQNPLNWRLFQYQRDENHLSAFLSHISTGINLAYNDINSLLIFSGGSTRTEVGPFSEGSTYWKVAENCNYDGFKNFNQIKNRVFTEDNAMDSFQNILFSICRFYEITGNYPLKITAISWSYKKTRFVKLHRKALKYPIDSFIFLGIDGNVNITEKAWKYEKIAINRFKNDLFGCHTKLKETRIKRNPYFKSLPYPNQCPDIRELFNICSNSNTFETLKLTLPWSD